MLGPTRTPGQDLPIYINKKEIEDAVYMYINKILDECTKWRTYWYRGCRDCIILLPLTQTQIPLLHFWRDLFHPCKLSGSVRLLQWHLLLLIPLLLMQKNCSSYRKININIRWALTTAEYWLWHSAALALELSWWKAAVTFPILVRWFQKLHEGCNHYICMLQNASHIHTPVSLTHTFMADSSEL